MSKALYNKMISENTPFSVIQYFNSLKKHDDMQNKEYQIMYIEKGIISEMVDGERIEKEEMLVRYKTMDSDTIREFNDNLNLFKLVVNDHTGKVYDRNDFKKHLTKNVKQQYRNF